MNARDRLDNILTKSFKFCLELNIKSKNILINYFIAKLEDSFTSNYNLNSKLLIGLYIDKESELSIKYTKL